MSQRKLGTLRGYPLVSQDFLVEQSERAEVFGHDLHRGCGDVAELAFRLGGRTGGGVGDVLQRAGGVLVALPVTVLFLFLQKYYVEGVTGGAVKG